VEAELEESIRARMRELGLGPDARSPRLRRELGRLQRELQEIEQRIPFWDRLVFFSQTADEERSTRLRRRMAELQTELGEVEVEEAAALEQLGKEFPPFALAQLLERALRIARKDLEVSGFLFRDVQRESLEVALQTLANALRDAYCPDLDLRELFREVCDPARRAELAASGDEVERDRRAGYRPAPMRSLLPLVARTVGDDLEADRQALIELGERREEVAETLARAESDVGFVDAVNVFSESPEEQRRDALAEELTEVEEALRQRYERVNQHLLRALNAYPPLEVYQRTLEVLGVISVLVPETHERLLPEGLLGTVSRVERRPLVYAALARLHTSFARAFPGVPLRVRGAATPVHDGEAGAETPQAKLLAEAFARLEARGAPVLRARALEHAELLGGVVEAERQTQARVSTLDWLVFWSDTEDEARLRVLRGRRAFHATTLAEHYSDLLGLAREGVGGLPPFALRDVTVEILRAIKEIHTDGGTSSSPRTCSVYGRGRANLALGGARRVLADSYGLSGSRRTLFEAVAACSDRSPPPEGGPFAPLSYDELVRLVASRVAPDFGESYRQVKEKAQLRRVLEREREEVAEEISIWDRINVFSTTEEEARNKELKSELAEVSGEHQALMLELDRQLDAALVAYPPAELYYSLGALMSQVDRIRAVCRRSTRTTGTGKNKRTETVYTCALVGHGEAIKSARRWAHAFVRVFGDLPSYAGVLEQWELWRLGKLAE